MHEILLFFNDIFNTNDNSGLKVGLSQFKDIPQKETPAKRTKSAKVETKISDLMRGT